jgi:hypothetical protein
VAGNELDALLGLGLIPVALLIERSGGALVPLKNTQEENYG